MTLQSVSPSGLWTCVSNCPPSVSLGWLSCTLYSTCLRMVPYQFSCPGQKLILILDYSLTLISTTTSSHLPNYVSSISAVALKPIPLWPHCYHLCKATSISPPNHSSGFLTSHSISGFTPSQANLHTAEHSSKNPNLIIPFLCLSHSVALSALGSGHRTQTADLRSWAGHGRDSRI